MIRRIWDNIQYALWGAAYMIWVGKKLKKEDDKEQSHGQKEINSFKWKRIAELRKKWKGTVRE